MLPVVTASKLAEHLIINLAGGKILNTKNFFCHFQLHNTICLNYNGDLRVIISIETLHGIIISKEALYYLHRENGIVISIETLELLSS